MATKSSKAWSRRELLESGGLIAGATLARGASVAARPRVEPELRIGKDIYSSIGVKPVINGRGTYTILSGSTTLPEVKRAMDEASRHYVNLDELMEGVGRRLAELTKAQWGIVTAGCSAAETLATCACVAGTSPEKMQRIPNLHGMKNEVVIPRYSRNVYDHGVRMAGVKMVTVDSLEQFEAVLTPQTAMVYVLACPADTGPLGLQPIAQIARRKGVPVFVDAAAENLTPEIHLSRGADLVAYSGGKAIRGPQCAGLLLGRKDLCLAAWLNSAPHHAFGRSLKVGKEEIMGMLAAVEMWYKRDHAAEWKEWESWLATIADKVGKIQGVTTDVQKPSGLSNNTPQLRIRWDGARLGISGQEAFDLLLNQNPRINLAVFTGTRGEGLENSSVSLVPWMMHPGEDKIVAARLHEVLSIPPKVEVTQKNAAPALPVAGRWNARLQFSLGSDSHTFFFEQRGDALVGTHHGELVTGSLRGRVEGDQIEFSSSQAYEGTRLQYRFRGRIEADSMKGTVDMGEYGETHWEAQRHSYDSSLSRGVNPKTEGKE